MLPHVKQLDVTQVKNWVFDAGAISPPDRVQQFQETSVDADALVATLCTTYPNTRIGSESMNAQVFRLQVRPGVYAALKVMPHVSGETVKENMKELTIAKRASEVVLAGDSPYFPLVYGAGTCDRTHMYESKLKAPAEQYAINEAYMQWIRETTASAPASASTKLKLCNKLMESKPLEEALPRCRVTLKSAGIDMPTIEAAPVHAELLVSELLYGDMNQLIKLPIVNTVLPHLIYLVLCAIRDLHRKVGVVHNDLHLGNVLLSVTRTNDGFGVQPVIHDFGRSEPTTDFNAVITSGNNDYKRVELMDVATFFAALVLPHQMGTTTLADALLAKIYRTLDMTDAKTHPDVTLETVIDFWKPGGQAALTGGYANCRSCHMLGLIPVNQF